MNFGTQVLWELPSSLRSDGRNRSAIADADTGSRCSSSRVRVDATVFVRVPVE